MDIPATQRPTEGPLACELADGDASLGGGISTIAAAAMPIRRARLGTGTAVRPAAAGGRAVGAAAEHGVPLDGFRPAFALTRDYDGSTHILYHVCR